MAGAADGPERAVHRGAGMRSVPPRECAVPTSALEKQRSRGESASHIYVLIAFTVSLVSESTTQVTLPADRALRKPTMKRAADVWSVLPRRPTQMSQLREKYLACHPRALALAQSRGAQADRDWGSGCVKD